jgi:hypothetical protein
VSGWYHLVDSKHNPQGQLKVRVAPPTVAKRSWRALQHDSSPRRPPTISDGVKTTRSGPAARSDLAKVLQDLDACTHRLFERHAGKMGHVLTSAHACVDGGAVDDLPSDTNIRPLSSTPFGTTSDGNHSSEDDQSVDQTTVESSVAAVVAEARDFLARVSARHGNSEDASPADDLLYTPSSVDFDPAVAEDESEVWAPQEVDAADWGADISSHTSIPPLHDADGCASSVVHRRPHSAPRSEHAEDSVGAPMPPDSDWFGPPHPAAHPRDARVAQTFDVDEIFSTTEAEDTEDDVAQAPLGGAYAATLERTSAQAHAAVKERETLPGIAGDSSSASDHTRIGATNIVSESSPDLAQGHSVGSLSDVRMADNAEAQWRQSRPATAPSQRLVGGSSLSFEGRGSDLNQSAPTAQPQENVRWHAAAASATGPTVHDSHAGFQDMKAAMRSVKEELKRATDQLSVKPNLSAASRRPRSGLLAGGLDLPGPSDAETSRINAVFARSPLS